MACFKAGWLQQQLGRVEEARGNVQRARDLYAALAEERPDRPIYLSQLACCWSTLGHCSAADDEKLRCFREGLRVSEALVRDHPDVPAYQAELARSHHDLGSFAQLHDQPEEAESHHRRALALWAEVQRQRPGDGESLHGLASAQVNLVVLLKGQPGRQAEAKELHDQAAANLERQLRADPGNIPDAFSLAVLRINWAYVLLEAKRYEEAVAEMTRNVAMLTPLREREPDQSGLRLALLNSHGVWATVLEAQERPAEEVEQRRRVRDLSPPEDRVRHQVYLAWALARAGDHARALAEAEAVPDFTDPMLAIYLAQTCALASVKAGADERLSTADRSAAAERCAAAAVRFVARYKEKAGPEEWQKARREIPLDDYIKVLTGRDDLKRLLAP
jgi:tetratricopeptide (TPR) repeat protein